MAELQNTVSPRHDAAGTTVSPRAGGLSLPVIRARDFEIAKHFYELLGLQFTSEKHGSGPRYFAATLPGGTVFESYPSRGGGPAGGLRLGLRVQDPDAAITRVVAAGLTTLPRGGLNSGAGPRVVDDADGNTVELAALANG